MPRSSIQQRIFCDDYQCSYDDAGKTERGGEGEKKVLLDLKFVSNENFENLVVDVFLS